MGGADAAGTHPLQECAGQPGYEWAVDIKGKDTFDYSNLFTQECGLLRNFGLVMGWNPQDLICYGGVLVNVYVKNFFCPGCNSDSTCGQKAENLGLLVQIDSATVAPQSLQNSNGALVVTFVAAPAIEKAGAYKGTLLLWDTSSVNSHEFRVSCPMFTKNEFTEDDQNKSGSNLLLVASADSPHVLVLAVKMPYMKAKFDGAKQGLFKDTIASPSDTSPRNLDILSIAEARRRAGSIEVEANISAMDDASLHALSSTLEWGHSMFANFHAELTERCIPASTVVSVKSKKSDLSDGSVAGMVIGSVACAAIFFGAAVYLTKMKNKTSSEYLADKAKVMTERAQEKSEEQGDAAGTVGRKAAGTVGRKINDKNHRVRVSEEAEGMQGICTDTPGKTGMIST